MDSTNLRLLLGSIAEQQYMFHLLTRILVEKGVLNAGELNARYSEKERWQFSHDLIEQLVSTGLKIDESLPSASPQELPVAVSPEATAAIDPASESKS